MIQIMLRCMTKLSSSLFAHLPCSIIIIIIIIIIMIIIIIVVILSLLDKFKVTSEHVLIIGHCPLM